jgi:hypothetical protein
MLNLIRQPLLEEALKSPALLSDLAGLESYIAESYNTRSFVELLQNADDAEASRFAIQRAGEFLIVANDGREFTQADFESLCRSASSSKHRGTTIGFRGIGFKSVVGLAKAIHLFSGPLEVTFSSELTARAIPQATRVPLVRIPHPVEPALRAKLAAVLDGAKGDGFKTVFIFADLVASGIEVEFAAFDPTSLLFLRHIRQVAIKTQVESIITVRRDMVDSRTRSIRLASSQGIDKWTVIGRDDIALAFAHNDAGIARLEERRAVVHAFLPTLEATGFPFKVNGDISTDPSRTRIILDECTGAGISSVAKLVVDLIFENIEAPATKADAKLLAALVPLSDPRLASFQRQGFKTVLYSAMKREGQERFKAFRCRPAWLNEIDFSNLAETSGIKELPRHFEGVEGLIGFLKFLGVEEAKFQNFSPALSHCAPSLVGAAEIIAHLTNLHATKQIEATAVDPAWKLWAIDETPISLEEARRTGKSLSSQFLGLITEKGASPTELHRMVASLMDTGVAATIIPTHVPALPQQASPNSIPEIPARVFSLKRWRGAEQQVLELLRTLGWNVQDVSRQNIGYDIEGRTPEGEEVCIDVKSIENPNQPFTLTSNEEAVAREKGTAYRLAVVRQTRTHLEVAFICDPVRRLKLTRQCRQWVWECATYQFLPERFPLE